MFNRSSLVVSLNVKAAWCDSKTLMSLYRIAKSFWELHKNALMKKTIYHHIAKWFKLGFGVV